MVTLLDRLSASFAYWGEVGIAKYAESCLRPVIVIPPSGAETLEDAGETYEIVTADVFLDGMRTTTVLHRKMAGGREIAALETFPTKRVIDLLAKNVPIQVLEKWTENETLIRSGKTEVPTPLETLLHEAAELAKTPRG